MATCNRLTEGNGPTKTAKSPLVGFFLAADVKAAVAVTDTGRQIPLFHYEVAFTLPADEYVDPADHEQRDALLSSSEQQFLQKKNCDEQQLLRLQSPSLSSNCHGWVFLGGRVAVKDDHIDQILRDNGYVSVDQPRHGDVALYRHDSSVIHSGIVSVGARGELKVESKWGPFSVFRHAPGDYFRGECSFWHSARNGHTLPLRPTGR